MLYLWLLGVRDVTRLSRKPLLEALKALLVHLVVLNGIYYSTDDENATSAFVDLLVTAGLEGKQSKASIFIRQMRSSTTYNGLTIAF